MQGTTATSGLTLLLAVPAPVGEPWWKETVKVVDGDSLAVMRGRTPGNGLPTRINVEDEEGVNVTGWLVEAEKTKRTTEGRA